jgi:hypothetical protein
VDKNSERPSNYNIEKYEKLNMEYPLNITEENIQKYEEFLNIAINVYEIEEFSNIIIYDFDLENQEKLDDTYSIEFRYPSQNYKDRKCVNLLIYRNHVVRIKNISALLKGQITKRNRKRYLCQKCQRSFEKEEKSNQHVESWIYEKTIVELPTKGKNIRQYRVYIKWSRAMASIFC